MVKILILLALITSSSCDFTAFPQKNNIPESSLIGTIMSSTKDIFITDVTLLAREERRLPPGKTPNINRDIGFASVFLHIENKLREDVTVIIRNIEICNVADNTIQAFSRPPQEIHSIPEIISLTPLANAEISFHFTNKTGYVGHDKVKAVVTYQIGQQIKVIESESVEIARS